MPTDPGLQRSPLSAPALALVVKVRPASTRRRDIVCAKAVDSDRTERRAARASSTFALHRSSKAILAPALGIRRMPTSAQSAELAWISPCCIGAERSASSLPSDLATGATSPCRIDRNRAGVAGEQEPRADELATRRGLCLPQTTPTTSLRP